MPIVRSPQDRRRRVPEPPRAPTPRLWARLRKALTGALRWLTTRALRDAMGDHLDEPTKAAQAALDLVPWEEVTGPIVEALAEALAPAYEAAERALAAELGRAGDSRESTHRPGEHASPFQPTDALGWARRYAADRVVEITADTRNAIRQRIEEGLEDGRGVDEVAAEVRQVIGLHSRWAEAVARRGRVLAADPLVSPAQRRVALDAYRDRLLDARARNIAHTELLTASNAGRMAGYEADAASGGLTVGAVEKVWLTAKDERICPICLPLNGVAVPGLEGGWEVRPGVTVLHPPAHPSCFPAGTEVAGSVTGATKRWWAGQLVEVRTAAGHVLAGTPNHPVLTPEGWVGLGQLREGAEVLASTVGQRPPPLVAPDDDKEPSLIEQVADSLGEALGVTAGRVPSAPEDFHGDGTDGEVDVVGAHGRLVGAPGKHLPEATFVGAGDQAALADGLSDLGAVLDGLAAASDGFVGCGGPELALFRRALGEQTPVGVGLTPVIDAPPVEAPLDRGPAHAVGGGEAEDRGTGEVGSGDSLPVTVETVSAVTEREFAGHVYNLETVGGWYTANGIIVHNCRCTFIVRPAVGTVVKHLPGLHDQRQHGRRTHRPELSGILWSMQGISEDITAAAATIVDDPGAFWTDPDAPHQDIAADIVGAVNRQPRYKRRLYSGHVMGRQHFDANFAVGDDFPIPLMAATTKRDLANAYGTSAEGLTGGDRTHPLLAAALGSLDEAGQARFLNDVNLAGNLHEPRKVSVIMDFEPGGRSVFYRENERITSGRFRITGITDEPLADGGEYWSDGAWHPVTQKRVHLAYVGPLAVVPPEPVDEAPWLADGESPWLLRGVRP